VGWFFSGYFGAWYVLFGVGFVRWATEQPEHTQSWWMFAFGIFAYVLFIPSMMFGLMEPVLGRITATSADVLRDGLQRGAIGRAYAFALGLICSLAAMASCFIAWMTASMSDVFSVEALGENGLAFAMVTLMMSTLAIVAVFPWLGLRYLLMKCRLAETPRRHAGWPRLVPVAAALAWAALVVGLGFRLANATWVRTVRLDFAALPPSDEPLRDWLSSQPGVINPAVSREGDTLVIEYAVSAQRFHSIGRVGDTVVIEYTAPAHVKRSLQLTDATARFGYEGLRNVDFGQPRKHW
jgi:hypothetical protein